MEALALSPEMEKLAERFASIEGTLDRSRALYQSILDRDLKVAYNEDVDVEWRPFGCKSARAVFDDVGPKGERFAMCIEYTLLFAALGRHIGLDVIALRQERPIGSSAEFIYGHIVAAVFDEGEWHLVDLANRRFWRTIDGFTPLSDRQLEACWHNNSGLIYRAQKRLALAEEAITRALAIADDPCVFYYNRGCVRLLAGKTLSAQDDLWQASQLDPHNTRILTNLAVAQNQAGERESARMTLYTARQLAPDDARIAFNLGVLAYEDEAYETALVHFRDALSIDPLYAQARRSLSWVLRALGFREEGLRVLAGLQ